MHFLLTRYLKIDLLISFLILFCLRFFVLTCYGYGNFIQLTSYAGAFIEFPGFCNDSRASARSLRGVLLEEHQRGCFSPVVPADAGVGLSHRCQTGDVSISPTVCKPVSPAALLPEYRCLYAWIAFQGLCMCIYMYSISLYLVLLSIGLWPHPPQF